jgi:U4/U6.U5 tri-snRNP component SNU23
MQTKMAQSYRKTWDLKEVQLRALEREQNEKRGLQGEDQGVVKELLEKDLMLRSRPVVIGKTFLKTSSSKKNFYCDICDVQTNDSVGYISHLNSKDHHKNLGKSINNVERSSLQQVQERFKLAKQKKMRNAKLQRPAKKQKQDDGAQEKTTEDEIKLREIMGFQTFGKQ